MKITTNHVRHAFLTLALAAAALMMLPLPAAHALVSLDTTTPAAPATPGAPRLEAAWERLRVAHDRLAVMFDHVDRRTTLAQRLIDRAKANGKDVAAVQSALDAFSKAVQDARPIYAGTQGIIASHAGFDASGNVTDAAQAATTVKNLSDKLRQVRSLLLDPGTALRDAIMAFRDANPTH